ncbi:MAG: hypothetical protein KAS80_07275 [Anaerolineales bacterium]|nr:hypothetical protein [Anaerolineales bacterium]
MVEEGVSGSVAADVGEEDAVSLSVGVCSGCEVEDGVGVSLVTGEGVGSTVTVSPGV